MTPTFGTWQLYKRKFPGGWEFVIIPNDDLREHSLSAECWCNPSNEGDEASADIWKHHALDGRSAYQDGARQVS